MIYLNADEPDKNGPLLAAKILQLWIACFYVTKYSRALVLPSRLGLGLLSYRETPELARQKTMLRFQCLGASPPEKFTDDNPW